MELDKCIRERRSIRTFTSQNVDGSLIEQLLENARLSPSAKNRQPWRFRVLYGEEKNQIAKIMLSYVLAGTSVRETAETILQAPALILVFKPLNTFWNTGDLLSVGAAIEHICLSATDLGLGSLWIRDICYSENEIMNYLGLTTQDFNLVSVIAVGYPDEHPIARPRLKLEELMI